MGAKMKEKSEKNANSDTREKENKFLIEKKKCSQQWKKYFDMFEKKY